MRKIKYIVIHCTATSPTTTVESIQNYWKNQMGWKNPGYHFLITAAGEIHHLLNVELIANGVAGYNRESIHVSYIGGIDDNNHPQDTRTENQLGAMKFLVAILRQRYPDAIVQGHRDFPNVHKACPSFDVKTWLDEIRLE